MTSKLQLVNEPALPSKCSVCGVGSTGKNYFFDYGVSIDYYGALLICTDCAVNVCQELNYIPESSVAEAEGRVEALAQENLELKQKVEALEHVVGTYFIQPSSESLPAAGVLVLDSATDEDAGGSSIEPDEADLLFK